MSDALSVSKWKSVLKEKENAEVKDTEGLAKALEAYAKAEAKSKDDPEPLVDAVKEVMDCAKATRGKNPKKEKLHKFLDGLVSDAGKEKVRAERLLQEKKERDREGEDEDEGGDNERAKLTERLFKVKKLDADSAKPFVLALGSRVNGLVISKTSALSGDHKKRAKSMRDGGGRIFTGLVYGEKGKYVFQMAVKPPGGLARALKKTAAAHTDLPPIRVILRGPEGFEVDDETDAEVLAELGEAGDEDDEPVVETRARPEAPVDKAQAELYARFSAKIKELAPRIKDAITARGPDATEVNALRTEAWDRGNAKDYAHALEALAKLETLLNKPSPSGSEAGPGATVLKRISTVSPQVKALLIGKHPSAKEIGLKLSEAQTLARKGEFDRASDLLDELEARLKVESGETDGRKVEDPNADVRREDESIKEGRREDGSNAFVTMQRSRLLWETTLKRVQSQLDTAVANIIARCRQFNDDEESEVGYDPADVETKARQLHRRFDRLDRRLIDTLDKGLNAQDDDTRSTHRKEARALIDEYTKFVAGDEFLTALDESGFTQAKLRDTVNTVLQNLATRL